MRLFDDLFRYKPIQSIFSESGTIQSLLQFEAALAAAEAKVGVIPEIDAKAIAAACRAELFRVEEIASQAALAGNIVIPMVKQLTEAVANENKDAARFVHWGATSQDAIDTAMVLQLRRALTIMEQDLARLVTALAELAEKHRRTPVVARTWLQQALPTTFGLIAAGWLDAILRHRARLSELRARDLVLQFGGAVGTLPAMAWHAHRDRLAEIAAALGLCVGTLGKIARDISLHAQTEIAELAEPAGEGRGGSSTMPHKRNPVACAAVLATSLRVPALVSTMLAAMQQEHQRALGGWQAEWETLPEIVSLAGGALHQMTEMLPGLRVDAPRMRQNLDATRGLIFAEAVTMALGDRLGKLPAHMLVEAACQKALSEQKHLKDILREDPGLRGYLTPADLEGLFDMRNYLGNADDFVRGVLAQARGAAASP